MESDNGNGKLNPEAQKPPEKTQEEIASERLARYQKNPEMFFELSEIVWWYSGTLKAQQA